MSAWARGARFLLLLSAMLAMAIASGLIVFMPLSVLLAIAFDIEPEPLLFALCSLVIGPLTFGHSLEKVKAILLRST